MTTDRDDPADARTASREATQASRLQADDADMRLLWLACRVGAI